MAQTWLQKYSTYEEEVTGSATGITAYAGGGQASATALTAKYNSVDTCASDYDSVKLVAGLIGKKQYVFNNTAKTLSVYPQSGEYVNGTSNAKVNIEPGKLSVFECTASGKWRTDYKSITTLSQITSNQNNYDIGYGNIFRLSSDATRNITGIVGSGDIELHNVGSYRIDLYYEDASSTAANRIIFDGATVRIAALGCITLRYDTISSRWRVVSYNVGVSFT